MTSDCSFIHYSALLHVHQLLECLLFLTFCNAISVNKVSLYNGLFVSYIVKRYGWILSSMFASFVIHLTGVLTLDD